MRKPLVIGLCTLSLGLLLGLIAPSPASAATLNVSMRDHFFTPDPITVKNGDTVIWTNDGIHEHTATLDNVFDSGDVFTDETYSYTFDSVAPGTYTYYCVYHGTAGGDGMAGTITVEPGGGGGGPQLTVGDVRLTEGDGGTAKAYFTVRLSAAAAGTVTVNYATQNGSALQPGDYQPTSGTLSFSPGQTYKTVGVALKSDTADEANETFSVKLTNPSGATIADGTGTGTIVDNDPNNGAVKLAIGDVTLTEGDGGTAKAVFTVRLSKAASNTVGVNYATANNTAVAPGDYTSKSGTLSFSPGQTFKTVSVTVKGGTANEDDEAFRVNLSSATNASILDGQGIGTIRDDD